MSIKANKGFSIIQTIISLGLLSLIFLAGFRTVKSQLKVSENSASDFELIYLLDEVRGFLSDPNNCRASFKGKSASYEDIDFVRSSDTRIGNVYEIYGLRKKTYGQNNLRIKSMRLESSNDEFDPKSGLTLLHLDFEKLNEISLVETSSKVISVHVKTNDIGLVEECFTLGSFAWSSQVRGKRSKWMKKNKKVIHYKGNGVNLGKSADSVAGLGVRGKAKILIKDKLKCAPDLAGLIGYKKKTQQLLGCNGSDWSPLSKNEIYELGAENIEFTASKNQKSTRTTTRKEYYYCEILLQNGDNGLCRITPAARSSLKKWNMVAEHYGGGKLRCRARCYH